MARTVLIDADISVFQISVVSEEIIQFGDTYVTRADLEKAKEEINSLFESIIRKTESDQAALFITGKDNFRKGVLPAYKENRSGKPPPMLREPLREHVLTLPMSFMEDALEGDDLIGIHATAPHRGERVIYSADKDLMTIPGLHWCPEDGEVIEVSGEEADRKFYEQTLTGDPTDNYRGCPKVGPVAANEFLDDPFEFIPETRVLKRGPNKGKERVTWVKNPLPNNSHVSIWRGIVSHFSKAGLTESDALTQARCARILRSGEYNFREKKVNLWTPPIS